MHCGVKLFITGLHAPFWTGVVGLGDYLRTLQEQQSQGRKKREVSLPFQCILDTSEGFRCFSPGKSITLCEMAPMQVYAETTTEAGEITMTTTVSTTTVSMFKYIMIATGYANGRLDNVEVFNTETKSTCTNNPVEFPMEVYLPVAMKHESKMVICGGHFGNYLTTNCFGYSNNEWNVENFYLEPSRWGAMSVEIKPGEWLIMGGHDGTNILTDTRLLKNGSFIQGPELPEPNVAGSSVMLNETHLFVAASQSRNNYLLDIDDEEWTQIAMRTLAHSSYHSSGTFYDSEAGEIRIADIGSRGIEVYSPRENSWHQLSFPSPITDLQGSVAIQQGTDSFILIGGLTDSGNSGSIYLFDENGLSILKENALQVPRRYHVAMPMSEEAFSCP